MTASDKVVQSFLYVADKRPVLVFEEESDAEEFQKRVAEAETFANHKRHVFLTTPHGLESVRGGQDGKTAYGEYNSLAKSTSEKISKWSIVFHQSHEAKDWLEKLGGYGVMYSEGEAPTRTVFLGSTGHKYGGLPIFPGVA
jgi:hypothetical protein